MEEETEPSGPRPPVPLHGPENSGSNVERILRALAARGSVSKHRRLDHAFCGTHSLLNTEASRAALQSIWAHSLGGSVGALMNALVDRGSPRDFADIRQAVSAGLVTASACWELWSKKNPGAPVDTARQKVLLHLGALESRRPLDHIADPRARTAAAEARAWFRHDLLGLP